MPTTPDEDLLSPLIRRDATRHAPPAGLAERIAAELRAASAVAAPSSAPASAPSAAPLAAGTTPRSDRWRRWLNPGLVFAAGAASAAVLLGSVLIPPVADRTGDEIAASHVRSLMASHLTDVASTDRHTVKPWFAGKLDFSPPVHDLAAQGYALTGGRLDVVGGRPVAALVYRERAHVINVFVWPAASANAPQATRLEARHGFNLAAWSQAGMQFWAVTDASAADVRAFADALRARVDAPS